MQVVQTVSLPAGSPSALPTRRTNALRVSWLSSPRPRRNCCSSLSTREEQRVATHRSITLGTLRVLFQLWEKVLGIPFPLIRTLANHSTLPSQQSPDVSRPLSRPAIHSLLLPSFPHALTSVAPPSSTFPPLVYLALHLVRKAVALEPAENSSVVVTKLNNSASF